MMELGATVCLPQRPLCLHCPVQPFCKTRGEHQAPPPKKMRNRQIAYALLRRDRPGATQVLLHQRPPSASLMPGMWELPEIEMLENDHQRVEVTLRHAITVTNYRVHVLRFSEQEARLRWPPRKNPHQWTKSSELSHLAPHRAHTQGAAAVANHAQRGEMKKFLCPVLLLLASLGHALEMPEVPALDNVPPAARQAAASIDPEKIRAHDRFLASDLLEGRGPGKRGGQLAAEYIATQFALAGAKPAGENGTYFQAVPLMAVHTDVEKTNFTFVPASGEPIPLKYGEDYVTKDQTGAPSVDLDAPIVFVGYGINAPEYQWNDFAGLDVKGKILLAIVNEPPSTDEQFFKGKALTYYGRWTYKFEEAARKGAAGVMVIHRTDLASYGWDVVRNSESTETSYLRNDPLSVLKAAGWIQLSVAQKLFAAAGMNADQMIQAAGKRGFKAVELPVHLKAHIVSEVRNYDSANVIAMVPGADPSPGNNVLYTAHYDHLGIDPTGDGRQNLQRRRG